jgi:YD repeat-containing protein
MHVPRLLARAAVLAVVTAPALPGVATTTIAAGAGVRTVATVSTVLARTSSVVPVALEGRDRLVGVTWAAGDPAVALRWRLHSGWTRWSALEADDNVPNPQERAAARGGTEPAWLPDGAIAADVRVTGGAAAARDVRVVVVGDGLRRVLRGVHAGASSAEAATGRAALGHVYSRHDWGANESMRRCGPSYARSNVAVVVHHTAQTNSYSAGDVPGMIRADYAYHVQSRGWCDIGYNLLVDRFGRIWEGRYGGIGRAVIGAHAEGFNTGTVGVAFLGNSDGYSPSAAVRTAFERVAIYAATTWHFDPSSTVVMTSGGSPRYSAGRRVRLYRVMGHRNTGETDCPGSHLYADLSGIRSAAHSYIYAPHFTSAHVDNAPVHAPTPLTVTLRISKPAYWSVTVYDSAGRTVLVTRGVGQTAKLSWDGEHRLAGTSLRVPVRPQTMTWTATAYSGRDRARPIAELFKVGVPFVAV